MTQDHGASLRDRAFVPSASSQPEAVSPVPASIPSADFTDEYRASVCRVGQGAACCRYLKMSSGGWSCAKKTSIALAIDARVETMRAKGDNCGGCFDPLPRFVLLKDRFEHLAGTIIYRASGYDYGLASDDARHTGIPHTSMTLDASGGYPSFTVPDTDFAPASAIEARRAATGTGAVHESAVPQGDAQ